MAKPITERQIVTHIISNWNSLFEHDIHFFRTELELLNDWRCDIVAYINMTLGKEYGYNNPYNYRAPLCIEVKYDSDSRDLIYELSKAFELRRRQKNPFYIGVISNDFSDPYILNFIKENDIHMWKIQVKDNDIKTMTLTYIEQEEITQIKDVTP